MKRLLLLSILFYSNIIIADIREYDISLLIFEDITSKYIDSEKWPSIVSTDEIEQENSVDNEITNTADLLSLLLLEPLEGEAEYPAKNDVINIINNDTTLLTEHIDTLNRSKRYKILVHKSWRQTGLNEKDTIDIHIDSTAQPFEKIKKPLEFSVLPPDETQSNHSSINGSIKVVLGRYLHFYSDLIYKKYNTLQSPFYSDGINTKNYLIKTHRRMRSKELHYIDHPLVGILVMALPVVKPEVNDDKEAQAQKTVQQ